MKTFNLTKIIFFKFIYFSFIFCFTVLNIKFSSLYLTIFMIAQCFFIFIFISLLISVYKSLKKFERDMRFGLSELMKGNFGCMIQQSPRDEDDNIRFMFNCLSANLASKFSSINTIEAQNEEKSQYQVFSSRRVSGRRYLNPHSPDEPDISCREIDNMF